MDWKVVRGKVLEKMPMRRYTSMRVGGPVSYIVYPVDEEDLMAAVKGLKGAGIAYRFLGNGTNIVVADEGLDEALIRLTKVSLLRYTSTDGGATAYVSGGFSLKRFIEENSRRGLSGLEKLFWIPGTIGGAVKMNAGSFGSSIAETLQGVAVINDNGELDHVEAPQLSFGYRSSSVTRRQCVLYARFGLTNRDGKDIRADMERCYKERTMRHPMEHPSAGSVFKGVSGEPAWKYIERAGLKGFRIGDACVSDKHANFIVNAGRAKASDIKALVDYIKTTVLERTGAVLEEEIEFWGVS